MKSTSTPTTQPGGCRHREAMSERRERSPTTYYLTIAFKCCMQTGFIIVPSCKLYKIKYCWCFDASATQIPIAIAVKLDFRPKSYSGYAIYVCLTNRQFFDCLFDTI